MNPEQQDQAEGNVSVKVKDADLDTVYRCLDYLGAEPTGYLSADREKIVKTFSFYLSLAGLKLLVR